MKNITRERKILENRRLDLDACKGRVRKARAMQLQPPVILFKSLITLLKTNLLFCHRPERRRWSQSFAWSGLKSFKIPIEQTTTIFTYISRLDIHSFLFDITHTFHFLREKHRIIFHFRLVKGYIDRQKTHSSAATPWNIHDTITPKTSNDEVNQT